LAKIKRSCHSRAVVINPLSLRERVRVRVGLMLSFHNFKPIPTLTLPLKGRELLR
jgi:hypothetical protein